jgi:Tol biopolymer transport system component
MVRELPSGRISRVTSNGKGNDQFAETSIPSPDGRRIAYAWYHDNVYDIRVIPKGGGQPKVLYTTKNRGWLEPYDWSPDGRVLLALIVGPAMPNTLAAISVDDGTVTRVKEWDGNQGGRAAFSPDGRFIAFDSSSRGPQQERDVFVMPAAGGTETAILKHPADDRLMDWFPSGDRLLIRSDRAGTYGLWSIPIVNGVLKGDPIQVRSNLGVVFPGGFTKSGEYFYDVFENQSEVHVATLDPATGKLAGNPVPTEGRFIGLKTQATWSPDGESLAYGQLTPGGRGSTTLAVHTLRTGDVRTYPITLNNFQNPTWNPDGTAIVVQGRNSAGEQGLHRVDLQKGTIAPLMPLAPPSGSSSGESPLGKGQPVFSPDGKRVFFIVAAGSQGVWARDLVSGAEQQVFAGPMRGFVLSPDGRFLAVTPPTDAGSTPALPAIRVVPVAGGEPVSVSAGAPAGITRVIAWSADGRFILCARRTESGSELWRLPVSGGSAQNTGLKVSGTILKISAHPDGRRVAISTGGGSADIWAIQGLLATPR